MRAHSAPRRYLHRRLAILMHDGELHVALKDDGIDVVDVAGHEVFKNIIRLAARPSRLAKATIRLRCESFGCQWRRLPSAVSRPRAAAHAPCIRAGGRNSTRGRTQAQ